MGCHAHGRIRQGRYFHSSSRRCDCKWQLGLRANNIASAAKSNRRWAQSHAKTCSLQISAEPRWILALRCSIRTSSGRQWDGSTYAQMHRFPPMCWQCNSSWAGGGENYWPFFETLFIVIPVWKPHAPCSKYPTLIELQSIGKWMKPIDVIC